MKTFYTTRPSASIGISASKTVKVVEPIRVIRAVSVAHSKLEPLQLAQLGADWLDGRVFMLPSISLCSDALGVGYSAIVEARGKQGNRPDQSIWLRLMVRSWMNCSHAEQAVFTSAKEAEVWRALEHVTDHRD
jgi:hypothetical protein